MKKFLLLSPFSSASGSAVRFWSLAQHISDLGHIVHYSERKTDNIKPEWKSKRLVYHSTPVFKPLYLDIIISTLHNLFLFFRHLDCDIFYALKPAPNNCLPIFIARLLGKKCWLDIDDLDYGYLSEGINYRISKFFFHFFPKLFHIVTCHTKALSSYINNNIGIHKERIYFLPQGISNVFMNYTSNATRKKKSIIYVATLGITSEFETLIPVFAKVFSIHPDASLTIVGDGVKRELFEKIISKSGISDCCTFTGRVQHDRMPQIISEHTIGINYLEQTKTNDCRAILKIREYLSQGLQVVCNKSGDAESFQPYIHIGESLKEIETLLINLLGSPFKINENGMNFVKENLLWKTIVSDMLQKYNVN